MILKSGKIRILLLIGAVLFLAQIEKSVANRFALPKRWTGMNESAIYDGMVKLQKQYNPQDVAQGWPNFKPPKILTDALINVTLMEDYSYSQYSDSFGSPRLVKAIAKFYSKLVNHALDPDDNIIVTIGATQALYTAFQAHTSPGDEWIIIEPAYEAFVSMIRAADGVPKFVSLKPKKNVGTTSSKEWTFDRAELSRAFNRKTKGILINTPQNPIGKVFSLDELKFIAYLAKKWNTLVISDEIYRLLIFDQNKHISIATLPGMFERTIIISSGGKAFSATGYRLGWAIGHKKILDNMRNVSPYIIIAPPTATQEAFAIALENEIANAGTRKSYFYNFRNEAESKRNRLVKSLKNFGIDVVVPEGGYFIMGNCTSVASKIDLRSETDSLLNVRFAKWMTKTVGVFVYPLTVFKDKYFKKCTIRLSMIKTDVVLNEAEKYLIKWKQQNRL